jgi:hypothetical protein
LQLVFAQFRPSLLERAAHVPGGRFDRFRHSAAQNSTQLLMLLLLVREGPYDGAFGETEIVTETLVVFGMMGSSCGTRSKGCCNRSNCTHRRAKTEVARLAANIIHL